MLGGRESARPRASALASRSPGAHSSPRATTAKASAFARRDRCGDSHMRVERDAQRGRRGQPVERARRGTTNGPTRSSAGSGVTSRAPPAPAHHARRAKGATQPTDQCSAIRSIDSTGIAAVVISRFMNTE